MRAPSASNYLEWRRVPCAQTETRRRTGDRRSSNTAHTLAQTRTETMTDTLYWLFVQPAAGDASTAAAAAAATAAEERSTTRFTRHDKYIEYTLDSVVAALSFTLFPRGVSLPSTGVQLRSIRFSIVQVSRPSCNWPLLSAMRKLKGRWK